MPTYLLITFICAFEIDGTNTPGNYRERMVSSKGSACSFWLSSVRADR